MLFRSVDLLYFYFIDNRSHHHHTYWTHYPVAWLTLTLMSLFWLRISKNGTSARLAVVFAISGCAHLLLDSIVGDVWWLAPFVVRPYALFVVPAVHEWWMLNFVLHWSFCFEIALVFWALAVRRTTSRISIVIERPQKGGAYVERTIQG